MDTEQKTVIFGLTSIIVGIVALLSPEYRLYILILYPLVLIFYFVSSYLNKIEDNIIEIKKLKEKLIISERLSKLEARIK
jgi:hypothetical protein|tara:strand:- start:830 stop:1069 length:240 start_codon:yes stop_codon:yes gene_type:complete